MVVPPRATPREIATAASPGDERVWVPQAPKVWFRPLLLNTVTGSWCNLLRVRQSGVHGGGSADYFRFEIDAGASQLTSLTVETPTAAAMPVLGLFDDSASSNT